MATATSTKSANREKRKLRSDLKLLATFVQVYCRDRHGEATKAPVALKTFDMQAICGKAPLLCEDCSRLLGHAFIKRSHCPLRPKPLCKKCPSHCYVPKYQAQMREVMKYSGRRLVMSGRLHYLIHLWF